MVDVFRNMNDMRRMNMQNIPRAEHPRPDFVRPDWMNLNGEWEFAFDDARAGILEGWYLPGKHFEDRIEIADVHLDKFIIRLTLNVL